MNLKNKNLRQNNERAKSETTTMRSARRRTSRPIQPLRQAEQQHVLEINTTFKQLIKKFRSLVFFRRSLFFFFFFIKFSSFFFFDVHQTNKIEKLTATATAFAFILEVVFGAALEKKNGKRN